MDDREVVLVTGMYVVAVLLVLLVMLIGGADIRARVAEWNAGFALSGGRQPWGADMLSASVSGT